LRRDVRGAAAEADVTGLGELCEEDGLARRGEEGLVRAVGYGEVLGHGGLRKLGADHLSHVLAGRKVWSWKQRNSRKCSPPTGSRWEKV